MDYLRSVQKRLPSAEQLPTLKSLQHMSLRDASREIPQRLSFFRKRIRIRGNSKFSVPLYLVLLFPVLVLLIILLLFVRHPNSPGGRLIPAGAPPSIRKINEKHDKVFVTGCLDPKVQQDAPRANAVFVVLARNKEIDGVVESLKSVERHFNRWFHYPYVFLNDGEFNSTFKETVLNYTSSPVEFGRIPPEHWGYPDWMDTNVAQEAIRKQGDAAIMYGGMESYHHMCRFYSGFFYKHELLQKYDWYWRVEPEIKYFCDITYDPFVHMARSNKTYGFTIAVKELKETVPNIFRYASAFKRTHNLTSQGLWEMFVEPKEGFNQDGTPKKETLKPEDLPKDDPKYAAEKQKPMPEDILRGQPGAGTIPDIDPEAMDGDVYNMCHYWSNFEIARLDFFRSQEYEDFFNMMDRSGGFWTERWGDAPIHSLAAGALLAPSDIHYFRDFGYRHTTIQHCPANAPARQLPREPYLERTTLDDRARRDEDEYWAKWDTEKENGVGCRCRCDTDVVEVEGKEGSCIPEWVEIAGGFVTPAGRE
ncbi:O-glycoside alpha-1,2-mannosyltransferase 4 [Teratosphaeriaceae sp. CCFEE 6253]|nr:O-glycoside alpha-1,2-mannosyltransferase 4 [Teratosphaeriaceae sp. CCFEE 6253]